MKQNIVGLFAAGVLVLCALASCAGMPPPQWAENMEAAFPDDRYIAAHGTSGSRETVEQAARTALSYYFQTQVSSRAEESYSEQNGAVSQRLELQTLVQTKIDLPAVNCTEPWRNSAAGLWEAVAYIERETGWAAYSARAKQAADTLAQLYSAAAEKDPDPFTRALHFGKAEAYAAGEEFAAARGVAQILDSKRAEALFEKADGAVAALPKAAAQARQNASVYLECPLDLDGLIHNAAAAAFGSAGFPVANVRRDAAVVCEIRVNEGVEQRPAGTFYYPELSGVVTGNAGVVFTFTAKPDYQAAKDPALARRRAYTALAQALRDTLPLSLENWGKE